MNALKHLTWAGLSRVALEAGLTPARIRAAVTLDELRLAIVSANANDMNQADGLGA